MAVAARPWDLVVFWKQNDSGLYGRRSDMLIESVARSSCIGSVTQFDAPIGASALESMRDAGPLDHRRLVHETTTARIAGLEDAPSFVRRTWVFDDRDPAMAAQSAITRGFGDFVGQELARQGLGRRPLVFWVYPTNAALPGLVDRFEPDIVIVDIVDDNRTWYGSNSPEHQSLSRNYGETLERAHVVLTNCSGTAVAMREFARDIHVIPNACEFEPTVRTSPRGTPPELRTMSGPVVGYVGNLSSRIDIQLLHLLATRRPDWNVVLIGSVHAGTEVLSLERHANVHLLGPRRHRDAADYIAAFDVAIIPHLDNDMTRAMQPLKAYVYLASGVPVVCTDISNLGDLRRHLAVARDSDEFIELVARALAAPAPRATADLPSFINAHNWDARASDVLGLMHGALRVPHDHRGRRAAPCDR